MKTVSVKFLDSEAKSYPSAKIAYDYILPDHMTVDVDGHVIVTGSDNRYCVCRVEKITDYPTSKAKKRVVCVVDDADYKADLVLRKRKAEITEALQAMAAAKARMDQLAAAASGDPVMEKLLGELKALS